MLSSGHEHTARVHGRARFRGESFRVWVGCVSERRVTLSPSELGLKPDAALLLLVLPQLLAERGLDPGRVIGEGGIELSCFDDPDNTISFPALGRLLAHAVTATGCSHLGLEIGRRNGLDVLGAIGEMARVAPNLGSALRAIILYLHLHDRGA
ncbi:MAG: hypothetical protein EOM22_17640, partial [Gammaproteobacteria bacterium]|nr:hypothetical protein [Gammaproteobacteria bacterium]